MADFERSGTAALVVWGQVIAGILAVPVLHGLAGLALFGLSLGAGVAEDQGWVGYGLSNQIDGLGAAAFFGIGCAQVVYVLPPTVVALAVRRVRGIGLGLLIGMGLTFVLNGACTGLFVFMMRDFNPH
jgi:hypothetical protein